MSDAVGIDLGTSNTVVAAANGGVAGAIVDPATGQPLIPSVISFHPTQKVLVGYAAIDRRIIDAKNTIFGAKRLIGRVWDSKEVEETRKRVPFDLRRGPNQSVQVAVRSDLYTLPEISAFVLRKAKQVAEAQLQKPVTRAVITVPANFNDLQREATKLAGALAGLDVLRILNEPTAAALAAGIDDRVHQRVLVYDFGGGTFDVTLLEVSSGIFRVVATAGDMFLGGEDIDTALANRFADAFLRRHYYDPRSNPEAFQLVRAAAEALKMQLSEQETGAIDMRDIMVGLGGKDLNFDYQMSRSDLSQLAAPFVQRTLVVCKRALDTAGWSPRAIDQLVLVGGSTRLHAVQERVAHFFGRAPSAGVNPDNAVAVGAAIHSLSYQGDASKGHLAAIAQAAREMTKNAGRAPSRPPPPKLRMPNEVVPQAPLVPNITGMPGNAPMVQHTPGQVQAPAKTKAGARPLTIVLLSLVVLLLLAIGAVLWFGIRSGKIPRPHA
jgi:molecular chaperone DnaK